MGYTIIGKLILSIALLLSWLFIRSKWQVSLRFNSIFPNKQPLDYFVLLSFVLLVTYSFFSFIVFNQSPLYFASFALMFWGFILGKGVKINADGVIASRPWDYIFNLTKFGQFSNRTRFLALWLQLAGFSILSGSITVILTSIIFFPLLHIYSLWVDVLKTKKTTATRNFAVFLRSFLLPLDLSANLAILLFFPLLIFQVISRKFPLFIGNLENSKVFLYSIVQSELTVGAFIFAILILVMEISSNEFSVRLSTTFSKSKYFRYTITLAIVSLLSNYLYLSGTLFHIFRISFDNFEDLFRGLILLNISLVLGAVLFSYEAFKLLSSPEKRAEIILDGFSSDWAMIIVREWTDPSTLTSLNLDDDPMVKIERLLKSYVIRGDINSFHSTLILVSHKLVEIISEYNLESTPVENYLEYHLSELITYLGREKLERFLNIILGYTEQISSVSVGEIKQSRLLRNQPFPGTRIAKSILEVSINNSLGLSGSRSIERIFNRAEILLKSLPPGDEYWFYNEKNFSNTELGDENTKSFRQNDNIFHAYNDEISFELSKLGKSAISNNSKQIVRSLTSNLFSQIELVSQTLKFSILRRLAIQSIVFSLDELIETAAKKEFENGVALRPLHGLNLIDEYEAKIIGDFLTKIIVRMHDSGLLLGEHIESITGTITAMIFDFPDRFDETILTLEEIAKDINVDEKSEHNSEQSYLKFELNRRLESLKQSVKSAKGSKQHKK